MYINDVSEKSLYNTIYDYIKMGEDAWAYGTPCSEFARVAWLSATNGHFKCELGTI